MYLVTSVAVGRAVILVCSTIGSSYRSRINICSSCRRHIIGFSKSSCTVVVVIVTSSSTCGIIISISTNAIGCGT